MTRHLLVPFDDSDLSERVLDFACSTFPDDLITVMYVVDAQSDDTAAIGWGNTTDQYTQWVQSRREYADELFARAGAIAEEYGVDPETVVAVGRIRDAIVDFYDDTDADLVVMGFHPRSRLSAYLAGEFSDRVIRTSNVPVALVK